MIDPLVVELGLIIVVATVVGILFRVLRQPLILAYIATGVILGASFFNVIASPHIVEALSTLGVAFLLFLVGLTLNVKVLREVGKVSLFAGLGQVIFTAILGTGLALLLGFGMVEAVFIGVAFTFSSTIIIIKLLLDQDELETLHGKIAIGILIVQDVVAVLALLFVTSFGTTTGLTGIAINIFIGGLGLIIVAFLLSRYVIGKLFYYFAQSQELLFLTSLSWLAIIAGISEAFGFSIEIGAFIAGITLAPLPYSYNISGKVKYLRDLFLVLFFVSLGTRLVAESLFAVMTTALVFSAFILLINPLIIFIIMGFMGYTPRTNFKISFSVAQISEFSLILIALGNIRGFVSDEVTVIAIIVAVVTIAISSYFITYADKLYDLFPKRILNLLQFRRPASNMKKELQTKKYAAAFLGFGKMGRTVFENMNFEKKEVLVVDFNPSIAMEAIKSKLNFLFADITDVDTIDLITKTSPPLIFSSIEDVEPNEVLLKKLAGRKDILKVLVSENVRNARYFYELGADLVIVPSITASERISIILSTALKDKDLMQTFKDEQLRIMKKFK